MKVDHDSITCSTSFSACEKGRQLQLALALLMEMAGAKVAHALVGWKRQSAAACFEHRPGAVVNGDLEALSRAET